MSSIKVPDEWTGEEALLVAAFLEDVVQTIWHSHGRKMGLILERQYRQNNPDIPQANPHKQDQDLNDEFFPF